MSLLCNGLAGMYIFANLITNLIRAWLTKDYRSSGMHASWSIQTAFGSVSN